MTRAALRRLDRLVDRLAEFVLAGDLEGAIRVLHDIDALVGAAIVIQEAA